MIIFLNSRYIRIKPSEFEKLLPGHLKGVGAFETMRLYRGVVFAFNEHMHRLARGLKHFHLSSPVSRQEILRVIGRLSKKTGLINARVRVIIWRDKKQHISISLQRLKLPSSQKYNEGYKVLTMPLTRRRADRSDVKSIDYKMFRAAYAKAVKKGFDEAILFNAKEHLVEGTRTNIFFVKNGTLFTPALRCGCLNGITRIKVIECARELGLKVVPVEASRLRLLKADEAFLTGSTLEIMPIKSVDGKPIGGCTPGEITRSLISVYRKIVRESLAMSNNF